ncbi:unnamed protein product [Bursaphelenchus okinawaensis]|uniref:Fatty-acid and retinol-binding protein 1 n=1 Tax=Bursaphelenchus okinawaensis TaxID=465554 RepID=A0A811KFM3_9BILA|nr:unnamed protein product [Bursaphelenchus okinawaensis]CAG9102904.1 unnamed protein product [Bursaphelenchus okinawaensis]
MALSRSVFFALALAVAVSASPVVQKSNSTTSASTPSNALELLAQSVQEALPTPLKSLLKELELKELEGLKEVVEQLPQLTEIKKVEELLKEKSPKIVKLLQQLVKKFLELLKEKKAKLTPETLKFFGQVADVSKDALKKFQKVLQELKPEVTQNLKIVFPEIASLLDTPAGKKILPIALNGTIA